MPKAKINHILSFSSEDPVHVANNILNNDTGKKWRCKTSGEDTATVVLQLEKASQITGIDIGNEHAAFIEVFVGRSTNQNEFKVLLGASCFMTPSESRQSTNANKVRMFKQADFNDTARNEKWDCVKIVCKQPYNRHIQYGLSFITISVADDQPTGTPSGVAHLGKFKLRPPSPNVLTAGSLFQRKREFEPGPINAAAAIRQATTTPAASHSPSNKAKIKESLTAIPKNRTPNKDTPPKPRNTDDVIYAKDDNAPNEKIDKIIERKRREDEAKKLHKVNGESSTPKRKKNNSPTPSTSKETPSNSAKRDRKKEEPVVKKPKVDHHPTKPFDQLLSGVVFVISGIQNPERADMRSKGLQMGAKYSADWANNCTHLICAFPNTPKFNQVVGKGKIVNRNWIGECFKERKRLPWRRFALDTKDQRQNESEDEIWERVEEADTSKKNGIQHFDSDVDTDEEIERIQNGQEAAQKAATQEISVFDVDTDEESFQPADLSADLSHQLRFLDRFLFKKELSENNKKS